MIHKQMDIYFQSQKQSSLYNRVKKLLISYDWSDCSFIVNDKEFKAHKLILGISSPVFEAMFYGPLSASHKVVITDINPCTFQLLLNYIYTDKVDVTSIEEAYDLLYAAKKYLLDDLASICCDYVLSNMSIDNVITVLNYPDYIQVATLVTSARKLFCQYAKYLFQEHINEISLVCLHLILESNEINISELKLIRHVFEWTKYYCEQNNIPNDLSSRRDVLISNGLFCLLRFKTLCLNELNLIINDEKNLLLSDEEVVILRATLSNKKLQKTICKLNNNYAKRGLLQIKWDLCHRAPIRSECPITINHQNCNVQSRFKSNRSILIHCLQVESQMSPFDNIYRSPNNEYCEHLRISIVCESDNSIIKNFTYKQAVDYDSTIQIEFPDSLLIKKDTWYTIKFHWPVCSYYKYLYGVQSRDLYYCNNNIVFEFRDIATTSVGSFLKGLKFCM
ncbi:BTB/POZ domain-containing protein 6 isoform X1 [Leptidea sinapis]|uniref:BTB/POZ domain-containing protein 6 isoform X1 n=2 Tax=Leptidea sinapis TaxID=189913 RepID=UPI00212BC54F|nr:BTB/POZ domain-containing protein 6 isoform X1 [Leptidea sinapis]